MRLGVLTHGEQAPEKGFGKFVINLLYVWIVDVILGHQETSPAQEQVCPSQECQGAPGGERQGQGGGGVGLVNLNWS